MGRLFMGPATLIRGKERIISVIISLRADFSCGRYFDVSPAAIKGTMHPQPQVYNSRLSASGLQ